MEIQVYLDKANFCRGTCHQSKMNGMSNAQIWGRVENPSNDWFASCLPADGILVEGSQSDSRIKTDLNHDESGVSSCAVNCWCMFFQWKFPSWYHRTLILAPQMVWCASQRAWPGSRLICCNAMPWVTINTLAPTSSTATSHNVSPQGQILTWGYPLNLVEYLVE